jgi:hypothetical protein
MSQDEGVPEQPLSDLCLWDSFSYNISVTTFHQLSGARVQISTTR